MMRKFLIAAVLFACSMVVGCTSVETADQHSRRLGLTSDLQFRAAVEDFDMFWLSDRNTRLSMWNTRVGY
jgi:hypothetical protein